MGHLKKYFKEVHPLFGFGKYLALSPPYDFKTKKFYASIFWKCYSALLLVVSTSFFIASQTGRVMHGYWGNGLLVIVIESITSYWIFITTCISIVRLMFLKMNNMNAFLENISDVDRQLKKFSVHVRANYVNYNLMLMMSQAFLVSLIVYNHCIVLEEFSVYDVISAVNESFLIYRLQLVVILISGCTDMIALRWRSFNDLLSTLSNAINKTDLAIGVDRAFKIHSTLCDLVDLFNELFGWDVFFVMVQISVTILMLIAMAMSSADLVLNTILWSGFLLVLLIMVIHSCNRVNNQRQRTNAIGHKLLYDVHYFKSPCDLVTRELVAFAQEISGRRTQFLAAGVFKINYALLHNLIMFIASYVVVIVQFQKQP